jgi:hypothetical protein
MTDCVLAIDPGPEQSAYVRYGVKILDDGEWRMESGILPNDKLLSLVWSECGHAGQRVAIEGIACYGMPVGKETFDTCIWIGRFIQANGGRGDLVYRPDVKHHLCRSSRAKDANVRQALIDRFGPGKEKAIGKKKTPGPLYGIKSHCWSALAVAVTWWDKNVLAQGATA